MALPKLEVPTYELTLPSTNKVVKFRPFLVKEQKVLYVAQQDSENEQVIMDLLIQLNKDNNQTFVIVTHSDYVGSRAHRIINMKDGEISK